MIATNIPLFQAIILLSSDASIWLTFSSHSCSTVKSILILFVSKFNDLGWNWILLRKESRMDVGERSRKFRDSFYLAVFNTN
jgi:hypothetical protein